MPELFGSYNTATASPILLSAKTANVTVGSFYNLRISYSPWSKNEIIPTGTSSDTSIAKLNSHSIQSDDPWYSSWQILKAGTVTLTEANAQYSASCVVTATWAPGTWEVSTLKTTGLSSGTWRSADSLLYYGAGIGLDASGNLYAPLGSGILKIAPDGTSTTLGTRHYFSLAATGTGTVYACTETAVYRISATGVETLVAGSSGTSGSTDGTGSAARFNALYGMAMDASGTLYLADTGNNKVRKVDSAGVVTTLAGSGTKGSSDGTGTSASFDTPIGVAVDASGTVYVTTGNQQIRKITPAGVVTTLVSNATYPAWNSGVSHALCPYGITVDASGTLFVTAASTGAYNSILKVSPSGTVTLLAGDRGNVPSDGPGNFAAFASPASLTVDASGNLYVHDTTSVRKLVLH